MKHENTTTISIYVNDIVGLAYDKESKSVIEKTYQFYNEKLPSDEVLKADIKEEYGDIIIDIISKTLNEKLSGTYKVSHRGFASAGERVGDVRGHVNRKEK